MRKPKYRRHSTGKAFVEFEGKRHYLPGKFNSVESRSAYTTFLREVVFVDEIDLLDDDVPENITVADLLYRFCAEAEQKYTTGPRSTFENMRRVCRKLASFADRTKAKDFGPRKLKAFRKAIIRGGLLFDDDGKPLDGDNSRDYVNSQIQKVVQIFKWAASDELVPVTVYQALATVSGLRKGEGGRETEPRKPVSESDVTDTAAELHEPVRSMLLFQWYTGARSGSICQAESGQFNREGESWLWIPRHKTEYLGKTVILPIGPQCQEILQPFMASNGLLFRPTVRNDRRHGDHYTPTAYRVAVQRAAARAAIEKFTPHQLRHARGELVRERFGIEAAQAILGHASLSATQIYTSRQLELAKQAAKELG